MTTLAPKTYRQHTRALLGLGVPLIGSYVAHILIGFTDTIMLGWYSVEGLAAVSLATTLFYVFFMAGSGFAWAVMPMVAKHAEANEVTELRRVTRMGLWVSILFGVVTLPFLLSNRTILGLLGQQEELLPIAAEYLSVLSWAIFPALIAMVYRSYLSALERTQVVLWVTLVTAALNVFLNWVLIFGNLGAPELGVYGAAIASLAMQVTSMVAMIIYVRYAFPTHQLFVRLWRIDRDALSQVFKLGWPISLTSLAEVSLFSASAVLMGWLGTIPLAAHSIALQLASLTFVVHLGLSNAATVRAGRAMGRKDMFDLRQGGKVAIAVSLAMSMITITLFVSFPEVLTGIFIDPDDPKRDAVVAAASILLLVAAAFQTVDGLQVIALGLLRGMEDTAVPMIYAAIAYWLVGMPMSYVLGFPMGLDGVGVWLGLVIGLATAAVLLLNRFLKTARP